MFLTVTLPAMPPGCPPPQILFFAKRSHLVSWNRNRAASSHLINDNTLQHRAETEATEKSSQVLSRGNLRGSWEVVFPAGVWCHRHSGEALNIWEGMGDSGNWALGAQEQTLWALTTLPRQALSHGYVSTPSQWMQSSGEWMGFVWLFFWGAS